MDNFNGYVKSVEVNNWIRNNCRPANTGLNVQDIDFMFHDYNNNRFMFVEMKTFCAKPKWCQLSTFKFLHDKLENTYGYNGFYLITLDGDCPETSNNITICKLFDVDTQDTYRITKLDLTNFLNFHKPFNLLIK